MWQVILQFLADLFDTSSFVPQWENGSWTAFHGWLHIAADMATWGAFLALPLVLLYLGRSRRPHQRIPLSLWIPAICIFLVGAGHLLDATCFWWPAYRFSTLVKYIVAAAAWGTVIMFVRIAPHVIAVPQLANRAETALKNSEALYASLIETLPVHVIRKDLSGRFVFVNHLFCELLHRPIDDVVGKTDFDIYPAELAQKYRDDDRRIAETGEVFEDIEENRRGDEARYFQVLKAPIRDADDTIIGTQAIFWDVTERRRAEEALDKERYLLQMLMHNLPDSIYFKDRESRFLRISKALATRFGLQDPNEAVGKTDFDFFTEEHARQARTDEMNLMKSGQSVLDLIEKETWPDGHNTWAATNKLPLHDRDGNIVGTFGISRDITDQKLAENAVRESERRVRLILNSAYDAFVAIDSNGCVIDWNDQAEVTFGFTREEIVGQPLDEAIIPERHRQRHIDGLRRFLRTGKGPLVNTRVEVTALHRDGHEFPVEMTISPIEINGTSLFSAFVHDITSRRRAQAALEQAKEAAEAANRAKSDFLANMSHEIRTPMNAIIGMSELILDTRLTSTQHEYLDMVRQSAESLLTVINDILDFSKIEAGKLELDCNRMELAENLGDTMKSLAVRAHSKGLELACHIAVDVPNVLIGDMGRIRQIVVNLVGNAIKFTETGEVVLDVAIDSIDESGVVLHFSIRDTGIGIPANKLEAVFEAFEQADTSTTRRFGGTGLGLAISTKLVELMAGRIWVDSQVGKGSTFHFTACFQPVPENEAEVPRRKPAQMRNTRVLIVDDNATNRRILLEILSNWGMRPVAVESVADALEELRKALKEETSYPLVITDVNMPDHDGFELAAAVKAHPDLAGTIVMMLTSGDRPGDIARCETLGAAAYMMKPIKQSELFNTIMSALQVTHAEGAAEVDHKSEEIRLRRLRVLLAEDSFANQRLAVGLLEKWGHSVGVANNGREALALATQQSFDVVLMDVQMPEMDGLEATQAIRERERESENHLPIIAMTAHAMKGDREQCLDAGMDDYISKPVRARDLLTILSHFFPNPGTVAAEASEPESQRPEPLPGGDGETGDRIDWSVAYTAVQNDCELLRDVADAFLEETPNLLKELEKSLREVDLPTMERLAHTLKGSARVFGAVDACNIAQQLESMAKQGCLQEPEATFFKLRKEFDEVTSELSRFVRSQPTSQPGADS